MKPIILFGTLILIMSLSPLSADTLQDNMLHVAAHAGMTYAITHGTEVVCKKIAGSNKKLMCTIVGVVLAQSVNIAYKAGQDFPNDTKRALSAGAAGSGAAALMIALDF